MNRIYKVVWSKVKNMYVVASELAKNRTKSPSSHISGKALVLSILLSLLSMNHAVYAAVTGQETGDKAIAIGEGSVASGDMSSAIGVGAVAEGKNSVVIGSGAKVEGEGAIVLGSGGAAAVSKGAMSWGERSVAGDQNDPNNNGNNATAFGYSTTASGVESTAWGNTTIASGEKSTAWGWLAKAKEQNATAWGYDTTAEGQDSTAWGYGTVSSGGHSTAWGQYTKATNDAATAWGTETLASGTHSTAWGWGSVATGQTATAFGQDSVAAGYRSLAFGNSSIAYGDDSIAALGGITGDGNIDRDNDGNIVATGNGYGEKSVAIGDGARAWTDYVYAVGSGAEVQSDGAIALGNNAKVLNNEDDFTITSDGAIAIGSNTLVNSAENGVAIGNGASVTAAGSVALGSGSVAEEDNVVSVGSADATRKVVNVTAGTNDTDAVNVGQLNESLNRKANIALDNINNDGKTVVRNLAKESVKVVNGTNTTVTEGTDGNAKTYAVNVTTNGTVTENNTGIVTGGTVYNALQAGVASAKLHGIGIKSTTTSDTNYNGEGAVGSSSIAIGRNALAEGKDSVAVGTNANAKGEGSVAFGEGSSKGTNSMAFGRGVASGIRATAWGGPLTSNGVTKYTTASGSDATAFGVGTTASGINSTSWGGGTVASDTQSTAWGTATKASGYGATSFGNSTTAENNNATAFGTQTHAKGRQSTAFGQFTEASNYAATAFGYGIDENAMIRADGFGATAFGVATTRDTVARGTGATAFGYETHATAQMATAFGQRTQAIGAQATAFGAGSIASGRNSTAFGTQSIAGGLDSTAYGTKSVAFGDNSVAMLGGKVGNGTVTTNETTHTSTVTVTKNAKGALAAGDGAVASENYAYAIGKNALASKENSIAIGNGAVSSDSTSLALGNGSVASTSNVISVGHTATDTDASDTAFGSDLKRRIVNVAEGIDNTDAVNVSQLKELKDKVDNRTAYFSVNSTETPNRDDKGATGVDAMAIGDGASASGNSSAALGDYAEAKGLRSIALGNSAGAEKDYGIAIGGLAKAKADGGIAVGTSANVTGANAVALGNSSKAEGTTSYAIGQGANAKGESSVALGTSTESAVTGVAVGHMAKATGESGVAIGTAATAGKTAIAVGHGANASVEASTAIGINTSATANHAVALGTGSVANEVNTVSVGNAETKRRIVNVADGTSATNAATVGQTVEMVDGVNTKVVSDGKNAVGQNKVKVNVEGLGQVASNDTGLVNGDTMHTELRPTDGTYVKKANTTAANLKALDTQVKTNTDDIADLKDLSNITDAGKDVIKTNAKSAINVTGTGKATVNKTDVNGVDTYAVSVTADGTVTSGNTDIVNGGTVYDALHSQKEEIDTALDGKANTGLDNITDDGKTVVRDLAKEAVKVVDGTNTTVAEGTEGNAKTYAVNVTTDGQVAENNEGIVSGGTVFTELRPADGNYIAKANTTAQNLTVLDTKVKTNTDDISDLKDLSNITDAGKVVVKDLAKGSVNVTGSGKATVTKSDVNGVDIYNVEVKADGAVANGDSNIVTGGTVHDALQVQKDEINTALGEKANVGLDNITDNGKTVVRTLAQEAVKVVDGTKTTVTEGTDGNVKTYAVNVAVDGAVSNGNDGIVSGGTVYNAIQDAVSEIESGTGTALANKANISLDNVNEAGHNVIKADAKSAINVAEGDHVTVAKTDVNGVDTYTVSVKTDGQVAQNDENVVSGGTVHRALQAEREITNTSLEGKANVALDNITDDGHNVIKEDAKSAINVKGGTYATVDKTNVDGVDTYTVNVANDGSVAEGNDKLVTGGTVYEALNTVISDTGTALDGKANTGLDNITDNGKTVVRDLAKESVKVVDGTHTTVTEGTEGNAKTYAVNVTTDGRVAQNNEGVVSGGTVYEALQAERNTTDTALGTKANVALDNITDAGHTVIKTDAKAAINVTGGTYATVDKTDVNGVDTYTVHVATDGSVVAGNEKLVTGGTVYDALIAETRPAADGNYIVAGNPTGQNLTALDTQVKTNADTIDTHTEDITKLKDLSNITDAGKNVIKTNAKEAITVTGSGKATVTKTDVSGVDTYNVEVLANGTVTDGNENIVSGGTVYTAIQDAISASEEGTATALAGKANVSLDNITEDGKNVITGLTDVHGGNRYISVTSQKDASGKVTYSVSSVVDGAVEKDNDGLVTGGDVFKAVDDTKKEIENNVDNKLDGKADTDLGNITNDGKEVIHTIAKDAVVVADGDHTKAVKSQDDAGNTVYKVNVVADGVVRTDNTAPVSGATVYNEVRVGQNGTYVLADNTAGANITALDTALKNTVDTIGSLSGRAVVYDSDTKDIVTLTGNGGTKLTNLKDAALTDTSTDAVTGRQLKATNDIVVSHGEEIENLKDLSTITNAGKNVVKNLAKESVGVEAGDRVTVTSSEVNGKAVYKVSANNNGVVEKDNTDLVSGGTVYDALRSNKEETETALGQKANVGLDNITEGGKAVIQNLTNVVSEGNDVKVSSAVVDGVKTYKVGVLTDGQVVHGDSGIVTGGTVYDALKAQKDEMSGALEGKANTNMDNLTDTGKKAVKDLAKEAVTVSAGDHVSVTPIQSDGNVDYKVSVVADGAVAKDDTGIITGGTVYNALKAQSDASEAALGRKADRDLGNITNEGREVIREAVADDLARKANADASNVSQHADDWGRAIATGAVEYDNVRAVSGDTVKKALDGITIEVDGKANTSLDNITPEGEQKIKEVMSEDMAGKANTNLDNLTKAGEQKVRDIMAPDLDKKADKDASNINIGVWSEKLAVGEVAEGNRGLVNGGTVYNALKGMDVVVANPKNSMIQIGGSPKYNDYAVVDVSRSDGRGRIMTGVITNPNDAYSAANVGYVNAVGQNVMGAVQNGFNRVNKKIDKVGANAAAMASLTPMPFEDDTRWSMAAALGTYHGEQAGALGVFYKPSDNVMLNLRGSFGSNENMGGVGVTIGLDKGNTPGVTKAQLVRLVNAQAEELKALKAEHQADKAEIAELKAMVEKLVAKQ